MNRLSAGTTRQTLHTESVPDPAEKREVTGSTPVPTTGKGQFRGGFWSGRFRGKKFRAQHVPHWKTSAPLNSASTDW